MSACSVVPQLNRSPPVSLLATLGFLQVSRPHVGPSQSFPFPLPLQDEVAAVLESLCRITPGGVLVFLPSFHLLSSLLRRWQASGAWARLAAVKELFTGEGI